MHDAILTCSRCDHHEACSSDDMLAQLRDVGMLKRAKNVEPDLLWELFRSASGSFRCANCGAPGLAVSVQEEQFDDRQWGGAALCERCSEVIATERLEVFPDARLCTKCQSRTDQGESDDEREFCPHCGGLMTCRRRLEAAWLATSCDARTAADKETKK